MHYNINQSKTASKSTRNPTPKHNENPTNQRMGIQANTPLTKQPAPKAQKQKPGSPLHANQPAQTPRIKTKSKSKL